MTRKEFLEFTLTRKSNGKQSMHVGESVTDPTFARTGRQMIFQPLNIEYRMKYPAGVPLDKDNPMNIAEFDKLYPDQFKAIRAAKEHVSSTGKKMDVLQQKYNQQQQQQQQQ